MNKNNANKNNVTNFLSAVKQLQNLKGKARHNR